MVKTLFMKHLSYLIKNLMYRKINLCFQKLNRLSIPRIQFAKKVGSFNRRDKHTIDKASTIKIFGPIIRLKPIIRGSQSAHWALSPNVNPCSIFEFKRNKTNRPEIDSINSISIL